MLGPGRSVYYHQELRYGWQPLSEGIPAFCFACMGTNNKFTAHSVFKHIFSEAKKRARITVVSFGADGDSHELKSMQVSTQLLFSSQTPISSLSLSYNLQKLSIPSEWWSWFAVRKPTAIAYVQDTVQYSCEVQLKAYQTIHSPTTWKLADRLTALHRLSFKKLPGTSIPMSEVNETSSKGPSVNIAHLLK